MHVHSGQQKPNTRCKKEGDWKICTTSTLLQ